jgi:hypothetical protein
MSRPQPSSVYLILQGGEVKMRFASTPAAWCVGLTVRIHNIKNGVSNVVFTIDFS